MKLSLLLVVAIAVSCAHAQLFGVPVQVKGGVAKTTNFFGVIIVDITLDRDASFVLDLYQDFTIGVSGFTSLSSSSLSLQLGYASGVNLTVTGGAVVVKCDITVSLLLTLSSSVQAGFLQYDASANWYNALYASSNNFLSITVPVPSAGLFLFVSWGTDINIPTFYGYARQITAGVSSAIDYAHNVSVQLTTQAASSLTATYYSTNPVSVTASGYVSLGVWFDLQCNVSANIQATISYTFSSSQLIAAGINATDLVIGYYDSTKAKWVFPSTGVSVNTNTQVVSQTTTHFSTWGVYAAADASSSPSFGLKLIPCYSVLMLLIAALLI